MVNLFIILPESEPSTPWTLPNGDFQNEDGIVTFIQSLKNKLDTISLESFNGYYDNLNIINFLRDFEDLADYYPNPSFRRLRFILKDWDNWRDEINQDNDKEYIIFSQAIEGHTFCEIAERQLTIGNNKFFGIFHIC